MSASAPFQCWLAALERRLPAVKERNDDGDQAGPPWPWPRPRWPTRATGQRPARNGRAAASRLASRMGRGLTARQDRLPDGCAELGADLVAVGVVDLAEDPQRLPPRRVGSPGVARAVVHVAEAAERVGLVEPVGEIAGQRDGPLVARDGFVVVTALMMGVAEAVPDGPLPAPVAQLPHRGQGAFAIADGLVVVAEHGVRETDVLERHCLPGPMARPAVQVEAAQGVAE